MTEQEQVMAMLTRIGAKVEESFDPDTDLTTIEVDAVNSVDYVPVTGYSGFVAQWHFNAAGELYQIGVWE